MQFSTWRLAITVPVTAAVCLGIAVCAVPVQALGPVYPIPATPIPTPVPDKNWAPAPFIGQEAVAKPIPAPGIPDNPNVSPGSWGAIHDDTYQSDTYFIPGPRGHNPVVRSTALGINPLFPVGLAVGITFDSAGLLVAGVVLPISASQALVQLTLIDPLTLAQIAQLRLPPDTLAPGDERPAGTYFYQDGQDQIITGTPQRTVWVVSHACTNRTTCTFAKEREYSLKDAIPENDELEALQPDWSGRVWFTSKGGVVGTLDMDTGVVRAMTLAGERIVNGTAADESGGVYIATTRAMYRFDAGPDGEPSITWQETYDAGNRLKPGQVDIGTGTTPTLMGAADGGYVTITDNADPQMHVLVWRRAREIQGPRLVCAEPVFMPGQASNENSLVATDKSIIVENNFGYKDTKRTEDGSTSKPGIARIDLNADGKGCHTVWANMDEVIPSVVTKMSLANGLIYTYTKPKGPANIDAWYFTAIDFETGKTVYSRLAGTGKLYNNNYAPIYLGPDGTEYVGVLGGIVALNDGQ
jgi:hypothetical protein